MNKQRLEDEQNDLSRVALEAVRRVHEAELRSLSDKASAGRDVGRQVKLLSIDYSSISSDDTHEVRVNIDLLIQSRVMEQMREELHSMSALYATKCAENAALDERIAQMEGEATRETLVPLGSVV